MKTHLEHEIKLHVPRRFDLGSIDTAANGYALAPLVEQRLITTYYDTDDLRLTRWGMSLRYRKGQGWTIKVAQGEKDGVPVRVEHVFPDDGGAKPPPEALALLTAFVRCAHVRPVARLQTRRRTRRIIGAGGEDIAEVADDDVRVMHDGRVADRFREVEVELSESAPPRLMAELVRWLQDAGAGSTDDTSKAVRALGAAALAPRELEVATPDQNSQAGDVIRYALTQSVSELLCRDPALRLGADPEAVHKARVATRRLRSDLRSFKPLLDAKWAQSLREDVQWLADELGAVRDADVLVGRLRRGAATLAEEDGQAAEAVIDRFEAQAVAARQRLTSVLNEKRYVELLDELVTAAAGPKLRAQAAAMAQVALPPLVRKPWKDLCAAVEALNRSSADSALHRVRIKAKRCRYVLEAIAPVGAKAGKRLGKRLGKLQAILGELQDAVVAEGRLRTIRGASDEVFAAGALAALQVELARSARAGWRKAWKRVAKRELRFWT